MTIALILICMLSLLMKIEGIGTIVWMGIGIVWMGIGIVWVGTGMLLGIGRIVLLGFLVSEVMKYKGHSTDCFMYF